MIGDIFPSENVDVLFCPKRGAAEKISSASIPIRESYLLRKRKGQPTQDLVLKRHEPLGGLTQPEKMVTSAVDGLDYVKRFAVTQQYDISIDAEDFINGQKKSIRYRKDILIISNRASEFLRKEGIQAKISISLFTDPEYKDWIEPKIGIEVPKNEMEKTYNIYNTLLSYSLKGIRKKTLRKLLVTIESS